MADALRRGFRRLAIMPAIVRTAAWFRELRGAKRLAVSGGLGALSALAQAPFFFWPLLFFTFPALTWIVDGAAGARRPWLAAAWSGWAFGFGYFLIGLHWVGFAFFVDADKFAWLVPFVAMLFPGGLALFFAAAVGVARRRWSNGPARIAMLAACVSAFEWLRGHVLTGLPWNLAGYAWSGWDAMFQTVSIFGIYGLSLLTVVLALSPAMLVDADGTVGRSRRPIAVMAGVLLLLFGFGWLRLPAGAAPAFDGVALRIVQPNVPQAEKWRPELMARNWALLMNLTREAGLETRTHVIWPEAAPPFFLLSEPDALRVIGEVLAGRATLLTGTVRTERGDGENRYFNSMAAVSGDGRALAVYDKAHLVPFGEYLPLHQVLEPLGISKLVGVGGGYTQGSGVKTLAVAGTPPFGPLICYEVIFPGAVVEAGQRPAWLVTMTDDSWFGPWTGPYQHLGIAKVRAAEEGLAIVRAANTGISAIIDPYGRTVASLALEQTGILDAALPKPLQPTVFSRVGDILFGIMLVACAGVGYFFYRSTP